jgi:hypothetical protein
MIRVTRVGDAHSCQHNKTRHRNGGLVTKMHELEYFLSQQCLEVGEGHLDRVHVGAEGRQVGHLGMAFGDRLSDAGDVVRGQVVEHHLCAGHAGDYANELKFFEIQAAVALQFAPSLEEQLEKNVDADGRQPIGLIDKILADWLGERPCKAIRMNGKRRDGASGDTCWLAV